MEWISVKDRLPEEYESVLVFLEYIHIKGHEFSVMDISEYSPRSLFEGFSTFFDKDYKKVTHWMPLPGPPK